MAQAGSCGLQWKKHGSQVYKSETPDYFLSLIKDVPTPGQYTISLISKNVNNKATITLHFDNNHNYLEGYETSTKLQEDGYTPEIHKCPIADGHELIGVVKNSLAELTISH